MNKKKSLKRFLHKFFKIFVIFFSLTLAINLIVILAVFINHKVKLDKERGYLTPPGEMVEVNGHNMHVYKSEGENKEFTVVFLHSNAEQDASIEIKPVLAEIEKEFSVAYVDRSGTGYSDVSGESREIDNILEETRSALNEAGVKKPYVIVARGTAGLEAAYWSDKYPDEVIGIVGVAMNYAEEFDGMSTEAYCGFFNYLLSKGSLIGTQRFVAAVYPNNDKGFYSEKDMNIRKALINKGFYTLDNYNEDLNMVNNAKTVKEGGFPDDIPVKLILNNVLMEPYINEDELAKKEYEKAKQNNSDVDYVNEYNSYKYEFFKEYSNVSFSEMSGPADLYEYNPEAVSDVIVDFIHGKILK